MRYLIIFMVLLTISIPSNASLFGGYYRPPQDNTVYAPPVIDDNGHVISSGSIYTVVESPPNPPKESPPAPPVRIQAEIKTTVVIATPKISKFNTFISKVPFFITYKKSIFSFRVNLEQSQTGFLFSFQYPL